LDVGCGIGGPAREIARFSGCTVVGINNNEYQLKRAAKLTEKAELTDICEYVKGDFMHLPFEDNSFDAVYQIEATAHAPDKEACYAEIFRVLKPGGVFGSYEWCLTDRFDPNNAEHQKIKQGIEEGDSLPDIATTGQVVSAMEKCGFKLLHQEDRCKKLSPVDVDWYYPLKPLYLPSHFHHTELGHKFCSFFLRCFEKCHIVSSGTTGVQEFLHTAAVNLTLGGEKEIFTPSFWTLTEKPA